MTENEKLDLILSKLDKLDKLESDMNTLKNDVRNIETKLTDTRLHIENVTDNNISLIAENFINLTNKLNQAIPAADKNLAYEVKVNYLVEEVNKLKQELADLKSKIA